MTNQTNTDDEMNSSPFFSHDDEKNKNAKNNIRKKNKQVYLAEKNT